MYFDSLTGGGGLSVNDEVSGGAQSFGNIMGSSMTGRKSEWLLNSNKSDKTPIFVGAGLATIFALGVVVYMVKGR